MRILLLLLGALSAFPAGALPVISVDVDPDTPGIQSSGSAPFGPTIMVDIVISGVEPGSPLNAFEIDLSFNPLVLQPESVLDGGFMLDPVFVVQETLGMITAEFAEVTLGPIGAHGSGVLAKFEFSTLALGTSALDLSNVVLSQPFGVPLPAGGIADGIVAIPEPSVLSFLALGLLGLGIADRRDRRRIRE